jgi:hypothetical protein
MATSSLSAPRFCEQLAANARCSSSNVTGHNLVDHGTPCLRGGRALLCSKLWGRHVALPRQQHIQSATRKSTRVRLILKREHFRCLCSNLDFNASSFSCRKYGAFHNMSRMLRPERNGRAPKYPSNITATLKEISRDISCNPVGFLCRITLMMSFHWALKDTIMLFKK